MQAKIDNAASELGELEGSYTDTRQNLLDPDLTRIQVSSLVERLQNLKGQLQAKRKELTSFYEERVQVIGSP